MAELLPKITRPRRARRRRRARTGSPRRSPPPPPADARSSRQRRDEEIEFETSFTFSDRERLQQADFEIHDDGRVRARQEARRGSCRCRSRRCGGAATQRARAAAIDLRATMLAMARQPETLVPRFSAAAQRAADDRRAARRLRLDGPLRAAAAALRARPDAALPARSTRSPSARASPTSRARCATATPTSRSSCAERAGAGLEGRHAHRLLPRRLQPALGATAARRQRRACCSSPTASIATSTAS